MTSIATPDEIKAALAHDNAVVIDVRKEEEIQESGRFETDRKWFNASGTPEENEILEQHAEQWIPNKHGRRAVKAKEILEAKGYNYVINAGGLDDLKTVSN